MTSIHALEVVKSGRRSVLLADDSEDPSVVARVAWDDKCPGCCQFFDEDRNAPSAVLDGRHERTVLCEQCVTVCAHDECEEIVVTASGIVGDLYDAGGGIPRDPNEFHNVEFVCIGCYEDSYSRCDCCEAHVTHDECGLYNVPASRYVRDNGHGTDQAWPMLPKLDLLDEDDALFARWLREADPAMVGMAVCDDCTDSVSSDVRRAEPFATWSQAIEDVDELRAELADAEPRSLAFTLRTLWLGDALRSIAAAGGGL